MPLQISKQQNAKVFTLNKIVFQSKIQRYIYEDGETDDESDSEWVEEN